MSHNSDFSRLFEATIVADEHIQADLAGAAFAAEQACATYETTVQRDGNIHLVGGELLSLRAGFAHYLAAEALDGGDVAAQLARCGPITVAMVATEALERCCQYVALDPSGSVASSLTSLVTAVDAGEPLPLRTPPVGDAADVSPTQRTAVRFTAQLAAGEFPPALTDRQPVFALSTGPFGVVAATTLVHIMAHLRVALAEIDGDPEPFWDAAELLRRAASRIATCTSIPLED